MSMNTYGARHVRGGIVFFFFLRVLSLYPKQLFGPLPPQKKQQQPGPLATDYGSASQKIETYTAWSMTSVLC